VNDRRWWLFPPIAWLLVFLALPVAVTASKAFSAAGVEALASPTTWRLVGVSTLVAAVTTAACLVAGYPVAWCISRMPERRRRWVLFLVVLPFWANLLVRTYALMTMLRPFGVLDTWFAAVFGLWHGWLPFMVLPLYNAIEKLPPRLAEAAADLGAGPAQVFFKVIVPATMPGIVAGCVLVFIPVLGAFATPEMLGGAQAFMAGSRIQLAFLSGRNPEAGAAMTLVLTAITLLLLWGYRRVHRSEGLL